MEEEDDRYGDNENRYEENDDYQNNDDWNFGARSLNNEGYENNERGEKIELKTKSSIDNQWENDDIETILSTISDPKLLKNIKSAFDLIDGKTLDEEKVKTAFTKGIETTSLLDEIDASAWDFRISAEEKKKFQYEQKSNILNSAFKTSGFKIYVNINSRELYTFLNEELVFTYTDVKKEINGFLYNGKKIVRRAKDRKTFYFDLKNQSESIDLFIKELETKSGSAWAEFSNYYNVDVDPQSEPKEYIKNMREDQIELVDSSVSSRDLKNKFKDFIEMEKEIKKVKFNKKVKLRLNVLKRSFLEQLRRLKNWAWKNKKRLGSTLFLVTMSVVTSIVSALPLLRKMKKAGNKISELGNQLKLLGEGFHKMVTDPTGFFRLPYYIPMIIFTLLGIILSLGNRIFKIGITVGKVSFTIIFVSFGKLCVYVYDLYQTYVANYLDIMADYIDYYTDKREANLYLKSGREVPEKLLNEDIIRHEEEMKQYEIKLENYEIEKEAAKRENIEKNKIYEEQMEKYRKELKIYQEQLRIMKTQNSNLQKLNEERNLKIQSLEVIISDITFQITEKDKDVKFWKTKYDEEKSNFDQKLKSNTEKLEMEKREIKTENAEEKRKLELSLENKYKIKNLEEQKIFLNRISILQDKLNSATQERDKLAKEKELKIEEKQEVQNSKDLIKLKQIKPPVLPQKPKLMPTVKKPKKPEVPHQKMKLNQKKNQNPGITDEIRFWTFLPVIKVIRIFPWLLRTFSLLSLKFIFWGMIFLFLYLSYRLINKWRMV